MDSTSIPAFLLNIGFAGYVAWFLLNKLYDQVVEQGKQLATLLGMMGELNARLGQLEEEIEGLRSAGGE